MVSKSETELCALEITIRIVERWLMVLWMSCGSFHRNIVTFVFKCFQPITKYLYFYYIVYVLSTEKTREEEKFDIRYNSSEINKCYIKCLWDG